MISAIAYFHKINNLPDPSASFLIEKTLQGLSRLRPSVDNRQAITLVILHRLVDSIQQMTLSNYDKLLFRSMFLFAFFGLCRIGEITGSPLLHTLLGSDVQVIHNPLRAIVTFRTYKHSISKQSITFYIQSPQQYCPVFNLNGYLAFRPLSAPYLFVLAEGNPVSRLQFSHVFRMAVTSCGLDPRSHTPHSLRIGGATFAARKGMSILQIKRLGRWRSNAFVKYLRW